MDEEIKKEHNLEDTETIDNRTPGQSGIGGEDQMWEDVAIPGEADELQIKENVNGQPPEQIAAYQETLFQNAPFEGAGADTGEAISSENTDMPAAKGEGRLKEKMRSNLILWIVLGVICVGLLGFGGGMVAADRIGDKMEANLQENLTQMLEEAGGTVLYRSVDTSVKATDDASLSVSAVTALCAASVVEIQTEVSVSEWGYFGMSSYVVPGAGSGVIISDNGYILTCNHVIEDAQTITVGLRNGESYEATLVASDEQSDVAILKIDAEDLTVAVLGDSDELEVGDQVVAIGNPLGELGGTVTTGIISALDREVTIENKGTYNVLQTDAAINGGNSGGGLFNKKGELIGMINAKASEVGVEGLGFALPSNDLKTVVEDLLNYGYVADRGATLGVVLVDILDERTATSYQVDDLGCYILRVNDESNAAYAGLQSGDLIVSIDGVAVENANQVVDIIGNHVVNDDIQMTIKRNGKLKDFDITLYGVVPGETATKPAVAF